MVSSILIFILLITISEYIRPIWCSHITSFGFWAWYINTNLSYSTTNGMDTHYYLDRIPNCCVIDPSYFGVFFSSSNDALVFTSLLSQFDRWFVGGERCYGISMVHKSLHISAQYISRTQSLMITSRTFNRWPMIKLQWWKLTLRAKLNIRLLRGTGSITIRWRSIFVCVKNSVKLIVNFYLIGL